MIKLDSKQIFKPSPRESTFRPKRLLLVSAIMASFSGFAGSVYAETSFERLSSLLDATPAGGWVKASTNYFSDAWPTGADAVQLDSYRFPGQIVRAWSSFAWDPASGSLMLWGGGHANYAGNEMYVWDGSTGAWGRGSLPSRIDSNYFVVGGNAPQPAHTYDNNLYLPVNGMFLTFGGANLSGTNFSKTDGTTVSRAGPFLWDPEKADPNKVGGVTGSGWNTANVAQGGNMWIDRQGNWTGTEPPSYIQSTTAYRTENGKDVVYVTGDQGASGFPSLYRYTLGDVRNGGQDTWEKIGITNNTVGYQGTGTLDTEHNLYIRTATVAGRYTSDLAVWDLDKANPANPASNMDIGINLVNADGSDFVMNSHYGIDYDPAANAIFLWDGSDGGGTVWEAKVLTDASGDIGSNTTWTVEELPSLTMDHPHGSFATGVLGKWHYDASLGAFIALDELSSTSSGAWDASVWLYKPLVAAVPEPETYAMLLAGLGLIGAIIRRRRNFPGR
ncbi:MAG TPA: PEP-CTERM sorting domain-containing protein [Nitrosospira sp.]|nr:PEP-CTERM sorting domain-containing protein [Nitrosospira sp.]